MRFKGTLIDWKDDRGFGFIEPAEGGQRIFCHLNAFEVRVRRPMAGDRVTYEVGKDAQSRVSATKVRPAGFEEARYQSNIGSRRNPKAGHTSSTRSASALISLIATCIAILIYLSAVVALAVAGRVPFFVPLIYIVMSGLTIFAYAFDKSAAMNDHQRTPEQTLHLMELLGGWPGAWIAQQLFRHKSRKMSFRIEFWLCVIVNIAALGWYAGIRNGTSPLRTSLQPSDNNLSTTAVPRPH
ncbi:MAG: cold shock and DUF1294 domain-containing protein [Steroidobacteraceae bacterium]